MARRGKTIFSSWRDYSPTIVLLIAGWLAVYIWKLNSLLPGYTNEEVNVVKGASSIRDIWSSPIDAPFKVTQFIGHRLADNQAGIRVAGLIWAALFTYCFYLIISRWFGKMISIFATLILAFTPIFIISARSAEPLIMSTALLPAAAIFLTLPSAVKPTRLIYLLAVSCGMAIYHPGTIWLLISLIAITYPSIKPVLKKIGSGQLFMAAFVFLASLAPLIYWIYKSPVYIKTLLAIPQHWLGLIAILKNFAWACLSLVWRTPYHVDWIIGRLSIFSVIEITLIAIGIVALLKHARRKALAIIAYCAVGVLVEAVNGNLSLTLAIVPALLIFAAAGIRFLYYEWNAVFPYNPIPRMFANLAVLSILGVQCLWGIRYGLIAWPHTPTTSHAYHAIIKQ